MHQFLKPAAGSARARIVAAELFSELLGAPDYAVATLDPRFGRISLASLARSLETSAAVAASASSWHSPRYVSPQSVPPDLRTSELAFRGGEQPVTAVKLFAHRPVPG